MSHGTIAGALSRGRHSHTRIQLALAAFTAALFVVAALGAANAGAAFKATGYSMSTSTIQAGAHPALNLTATLDAAAGDASGDDLQQLSFDLPAGMLFNPQAIATPCATADFNADRCAAATQVGQISLSYRVAGSISTATGSIYSITPDTNSVINFGFIVRPSTKFQKLLFTSGRATGLTTVRQGLDKDYGLNILVPNIPRTIKTTPVLGLYTNTSMTISSISLTFNSRANATQTGSYFVYSPTRCDGVSSQTQFTSYSGITQTHASGYIPTGCDQLQFDPSFEIRALNQAADQPTGINATVYVPTGEQAIQQSHVKKVSVTLDQGTTVNLDVLNAIPTCSELYLQYDACSSASAIGTAAVNVPFLPAPMTGTIYLTSTSPIQFGYILRGARGTYAILRGSAGVSNGGVTATFDTLPQVPWTSANMEFSSQLVNNPTYACPYATAWAYVDGWSGASSIYGALYGQYGCPPPDTIISTTFGGPTNDSTPTLSFTANPDRGATFKCKVDAAAWTPCSSPWTTPVLADGTHSLAVRAFNSAGTGDFTPATRKVIVDTVKPVIDITYPAAGAVIQNASGDVTVNFTTEAGTTNYCRFDSASIDSCSATVAATNLADGAHKIRVYSIDQAGNLAYVDRAFTVQRLQPPTVTIQSPTQNQTFPTNEVTADFTVTSPSNTPLTSVSCTIVYYQDFGSWVYEYDEYTKTPCATGSKFTIDPEESRRLRIDAEDANGLVGTSFVDFTAGKRPPYSPGIPDNDDVSEGRLTDRTPTIGLYDRDGGRWPNQVWECSLTLKTAPAVWTPCGSPSDVHPFEVTDPLADGEWRFQVRSSSGSIVGSPTTMDFSVGNWSARYEAATTTTQAGAHPDLDVTITPDGAGQFHTIDLTLPKGLMGSLNSFPKCPLSHVPDASCDPSTKIGSVITDVQITGLTSLRPLEGDVYLTEPQVAGDVAGMVINVYGPVSPFADTIIPLRMQLVENAEVMRVFSDSIPTRVGDIYDPEKFTHFWVNEFKMHIDGSAGSPYPLLTNPSRCAPGQFAATFGDNQGNKTGVKTVAYQATGCESLAFAPTITQQFSSTEAGAEAGVVTDVALPVGHSTISSILVNEPAVLGPNYPAFGRAADRCPGSAAPGADGRFDPTNCNSAAEIGTMTVESPLLTEPLSGPVYLINKTPLPWLGVKLQGQGILIRLYGVTNIVNEDPQCGSVSGEVCQTRIAVRFDNIPDLPLSSVHIDLNRPDRKGLNGATLSSKMLVAAEPGDTTCTPLSSVDSVFTPSSGGATVSSRQPVSFTGC